MELKIDRSRWRSGWESPTKSGSGTTCLLNERGYMCCLGFYCLALGYAKNDIRDIDDPSMLYEIDLIEEWLSANHWERLQELVEVNDHRGLTRQEREAEVKRLFRPHVEVVFTGEYESEG